MKVTSKKPNHPDAGELGTTRLAELVKTYAPYDGSFETKVPGVHVFRRSKMNTEKLHVFAQASLCVVAQGAKTVMLDKEVFEYDASKMIVYSLDMPVTIQVTQASFAEPLLGVGVVLDPQKIAELTLKVYPHGIPPVRDNRAIYVGHSDEKIVQAAVRLLEMIPEPGEAQILGSLVVDEILIRLLRGPLGPRLAQLGLKDSGVRGVSKAVNWLRDNYKQPIKIESLAKLANMSVSTFHTHFKSVTAMSPLQFQKVLRLQEARRLMLTGMMDAGISSRQVGYLSPSQFSREYGRFFGAAPTQDIAKLRESMVGVGEA